ncbi:oxidoreductase [Paramyrothecium foliicola]|nr:oxidoreductase [Paramyrothecium foliicola]
MTILGWLATLKQPRTPAVKLERMQPTRTVVDSNTENHPDVKLVDPIDRYKDFEYTFPPPVFPSLQIDFKSPPDCGEKSYKGNGRLKGLKVLITGGDSGIGRAVVIAFAREGAKVAINYLNEEWQDAEDLASFLEREGLSIERVPGDLRSEAFCEKLVKEAVRRLGGLDILINNAGYAPIEAADPTRPPYEYSTKEMLRCFETNVFAPFWLVSAAGPYLPRGGSVIFTASSIVPDPQPFAVEYGASKGAVTHMVRSMAKQLISQGIRVNGIAPGLTYTPLLAGFGNLREMLNSYIPLLSYRRPAQPAELAPLYVSLADPLQTYTSGEIYSCTGAMIGA